MSSNISGVVVESVWNKTKQNKKARAFKQKKKKPRQKSE